jgi:hypothetical protein
VYFTYGRAEHYALNQMYEHGQDPIEALYQWAEAEVRDLSKRLGVVPEVLAEEYQDLFRDVAKVLRHYQLWPKSRVTDELSWLAFEREFSVPLRPQMYARASGTLRFEGRFDGIVAYRGQPWVWEVKSARTIKKGQLEYLSHDLQASAYAYACQEIYGSCGGILYTFLRKKAPVDPRILKNGTLSQAKNQDTSPWWYEHKLREYLEEEYDEAYRKHELMEWDVNATDYVEAGVNLNAPFLAELEMNHTPFFRRIEITRPTMQLNAALRTMYEAGLEMRRLSRTLGGGQYYKSARHVLRAEPSWLNCRSKGCQFYIPCLLQQQGANWHEYLRANFSPRRKWDPDLDREEKA